MPASVSPNTNSPASLIYTHLHASPMKTLFRILLLAISFPMVAHAAPIGICLHAYAPEAPADKIECFEFERSETISDGKRFFLKNGQTVIVTTYRNRGVILYPNNPPAPAAILETYETQARQIPATRQFLNPWILKLRSSVAETSKQAEAVSNLPTITTTDGKSYTGVTITKADPDGLRIMHEAGSAKIPFEKLPEALRAKYGYDVAKATEFRRNQAAKDEAAEKALETAIQTSEASVADQKKTAITESSFEKLPEAIAISATGGQFDVNEVYQFTGPVIQMDDKRLFVQNLATKQPFGVLVFGDPKKVGNVAVNNGTMIQAKIRFNHFKSLPMVDGTSQRLAVFDCLGFMPIGQKYIDTSTTTVPKDVNNTPPPKSEASAVDPKNTAAEAIYQNSGDAAVAEARKFMVGTWTYTGTKLQLAGGSVWIKWTVNSDGTMLYCWSQATEKDWPQQPKTNQWEITTGKYSDTGERYYAFRMTGDVKSSLIRKDGKVIYSVGDVELTMDRGDKFPFSK